MVRDLNEDRIHTIALLTIRIPMVDASSGTVHKPMCGLCIGNLCTSLRRMALWQDPRLAWHVHNAAQATHSQ